MAFKSDNLTYFNLFVSIKVLKYFNLDVSFAKFTTKWFLMFSF